MAEVHQRAIWAASLLMLVLTLPARAQLQIGDAASMNLNGIVSFGYAGDYSNYGQSSHSLTPSGNADLSGYYYSPGFVTFDVQPFYNQSRANSTYQSVFQSGGVTGTASIFSGSNFPGSVSYSRVYNSEGGFSVPGVGNLTTRGNSGNLVLGWGIRIPDYPKVSFQFSDGSNDSSIYGTSANSVFHSKMYGVTASHLWEGFNFNGGYHHNTTNSQSPDLLTGTTATEISDTSTNSYDGSITHRLPMHGAFSVGGGRSDIQTAVAGEKFKGTIDTASSGIGFEPITNLNIGVTAQYTDNLEGTIYSSALTSGAIIPSALLNYSTHSLDINGQGIYTIPKLHLTALANADRRSQTALGESLSATSYDEMLTYANEFMKGFLTVTCGATQTTVNVSAANSKGYLGNILYTRKLQRWSFSGGFGYSRNSQTTFIGYTSSGHNYTAGIGRKIGTSSYWSFNLNEAKSTVNNSAGANNFNQSYSTSLSLKRFSVSGSVGKADGTSILTPSGLVPISNPTPGIPLFQEIVFNGKSYSFGSSTNPIHGLVLSGTYSRTRSETQASGAFSRNTTAMLNTQLQYRLRQIWITGGYLKVQQGFTITGLAPTSDSSFFIGITRWFKFF
jgi:hypothetical protein